MHLPPLIQDLAVILGVAALVTFIFRRIRQPLVLGYIVAGLIVGPYTPSVFSVRDTESVQIWAELGVIFLMFTLGLEFSFRRLARVGMSAGVTAMVQIVAMLLWGLVTANVLGWGWMDAAFLGCMIAISSTTIIIKSLEELGLKSKHFAELVFGILIVEDLAAILMLVALTNIATSAQVGGIELLWAGGKLAIVIGAWFVGGMFLVPRFVKLVSRHGNDEMMTVMAAGLCLALVAVAAFFHYSVALGAFIMGSILAESAEAKRIEHLVAPLKDVFGAVFFVSVGMLLDPHAIWENLGAVVLISLVIIVGKMLAVTLAAFGTGQTVRNAVQTGFSMAQIGEFSFIIAALGLRYEVITPTLYPIIVAASLVTTFTTPYLMRSSARVALRLERRLPPRVRTILDNYVAWVQRRSIRGDWQKVVQRSLTKWGLNAVVVITLFTIGADKLIPFCARTVEGPYLAGGLAWLASFALASPSLWAMLGSFRGLPARPSRRSKALPHGGAHLTSRILTVGLVGLLSTAFFPALATFAVTASICGALFFLFRRQLEGYYRWFEMQFQSGFQADLGGEVSPQKKLKRLAPWDAHLVEVRVPARSFLAGRSLFELQLREKYGLNVVVIVREAQTIVAPKASEPLYPSDNLLCFATDSEIKRFQEAIASEERTKAPASHADSYDMQRLRVDEHSAFKDASIRTSGIRETYDCIVVGLERNGAQIRSPQSTTILLQGDVYWMVGGRENLARLAAAWNRASQ